jgi:hypothetical protein
MNGFVKALKQQWPCESPRTPVDDSGVYIDTSAAMVEIMEKWNIWFQNHLFHKYLNQIEEPSVSAFFVAKITEPCLK